MAETRLSLRGAWTALVTPFRGGEVDERALREAVEFQIAGGINGLVPCGSTGESSTLTYDEHIRTIQTVVEAARKRVPVLAGAGANSTAEALHLCLASKEVGADGVLVVAPYYNRPSRKGLLLHYRALLDAVDLPLVLYNIPGRTGVNVEPDTVAALAGHPRFAGVKESAGSCDQVSRLLEACGPEFQVLSGDDSLTLPFMSVGAAGVISVLSNVLPKETSLMVRAMLEGRPAAALEIHRRLFPLMRALFVETNPVPVKTALGLLGRCDPFVRPPLAALEDASLAKLKAAMKACGAAG
ncbi:MAG: 4-hydroxy-tetrahydrodipicolinate synthase [Candidatus Coatesbacteria bacterium]